MNNICNLIENKKIIDKDSIYYFWKSCIKQEELFNECNVLDFCSINNPFYAYYSADEKKIVLNLDMMIDGFKDICDYYELKNNEYYGYINIRILQFVLHEIEHAKQEKKLKSYTNNLEMLLLSCSKLNMELWELIEGGYKKYNETYIYNPSERMAEIRSYKKILSFIELINKDSKIDKTFNILKREYIIENLNGYLTDMCPSEIYLVKTELDNIWKSMSFYDDDRNIMNEKAKKEYNIGKRLFLGLPIDNEEFKKMSLIRNKIMI